MLVYQGDPFNSARRGALDKLGYKGVQVYRIGSTLSLPPRLSWSSNILPEPQCPPYEKVLVECRAGMMTKS